MALQLPLIHLNGTSKRSLEDAVNDAYSALHKAIDMLCPTAPNGRDYYPLGPAALKKAETEHRSRAARLHEVAQELCDLAEGISNGGHKS